MINHFRGAPYKHSTDSERINSELIYRNRTEFAQKLHRTLLVNGLTLSRHT